MSLDINEISFAEGINLALTQAMTEDEKVLCFGLGVDDPKRIFGTTTNLVEKFGTDRVFDMPTSENGMTGVAIGASLRGFRPVMVHQRTDFFYLAMDQLINNAAKWHYMFGGQDNVPITIRLIVGRGWGQGPTHSQNSHSMFAQIPGIKVVMPATTADAKNLLLTSIKDPNPVIFIEHRWLHNQKGCLEKFDTSETLGKAKKLHAGDDVTIVSMSYLSIEALHAARALSKVGINCDVIDLRTVRPIDWEMIQTSVAKTGRLIVCDSGPGFISLGSEIVSKVSRENFDSLCSAPVLLSQPDCPIPTSFGLSDQFYFGSDEIIKSVKKILNKDNININLSRNMNVPHDVPGDWFTGPF
jgi:pyruvate dehydrogenase E1 component beta subunit